MQGAVEERRLVQQRSRDLNMRARRIEHGEERLAAARPQMSPSNRDSGAPQAKVLAAGLSHAA
jgi:hypothetical protein